MDWCRNERVEMRWGRVEKVCYEKMGDGKLLWDVMRRLVMRGYCVKVGYDTSGSLQS